MSFNPADTIFTQRQLERHLAGSMDAARFVAEVDGTEPDYRQADRWRAKLDATRPQQRLKLREREAGM